MQNKVNIKINGVDHQTVAGLTILEACQAVDISIPTLCYLKDINERGSCSICVVEVKGARNLVRSCITKIREGMEIYTNSSRVRNARKLNLELLLSNHPAECFTCDRNLSCDLRKIAFDLGVRDIRFEKIKKHTDRVDDSSVSLVRDADKCILCGKCVAVCSKMQSVRAIDFSGRGITTKIATAFDKGLGDSQCVNCGQCLIVCPTGAITEKNNTDGVWKEIYNTDKVVVVQTAPAVRVAIGEEFGMPTGSLVTGKMAAALRKLGFDKVFDTDFTADLTIMEEGSELIERINNKGTLPMITSCSPGWIKFIEHFYPELTGHVSTCKSPQQMFGAIAKTYYAKKMGIDPRKITVVSIMPCTAKKFEAKRPEMAGAFDFWKKELGLKENEMFFDVDYVLTTREAARMIKEAGIDFVGLKNEDFDKPLGISTGAAVIFGVTGGVMEAALRTAYEIITSKTLPRLEFEDVRGLDGIKSAEVDVNGLKVKVAVAHTLSNARKLLDEIKSGKSPYHFIEIMTCPGGCIGGGGQPLSDNPNVLKKRAAAIYTEDEKKTIRKSHENPAVQDLYKEFLVKPLGELSHHLLHTKYTKR